MSLSESPNPVRTEAELRLMDLGSRGRRPYERFIEDRFASAYGATIEGHYPLICGLQSPVGGIVAAAGLRHAADEPLFLECYLDQPVEQAVARALARPLVRCDIVEIGSLAADGPAAALHLFRRVAEWLDASAGPRFAVATLRPELARLLTRSGFALRRIGAADPSRLGAAAARWGSYYAGQPEIFAGEIRPSTQLPVLCRDLDARLADRRQRRLARAAS